MLGSLEQTYEVVGKVHENGLESICRIRHRAESRVYEARIIPVAPAADPEFLAKVKEDLQALTELRHSHVATVREFAFTAEGNTILVVEPAEGEILRTLHQEKGPPELSDILEIVDQLLQAIIALDDLGLAPSSLSPGEIIVARDRMGYYQVKLVNFGLARFLRRSSPPTPEELAYASPEHFVGHGRGVDRDVRHTLYSLGVVLYELLTGQLPFKGEGAEARAQSIVRSFDQTDHEKWVPKRLRRLVLQTLARNPMERPQTPRKLLEELRSLEKQRQPRRWWLVAALFVPFVLASLFFLHGQLPIEKLLQGWNKPWVADETPEPAGEEAPVPPKKKELFPSGDPPPEEDPAEEEDPPPEEDLPPDEEPPYELDPLYEDEETMATDTEDMVAGESETEVDPLPSFEDEEPTGSEDKIPVPAEDDSEGFLGGVWTSLTGGSSVPKQADERPLEDEASTEEIEIPPDDGETSSPLVAENPPTKDETPPTNEEITPAVEEPTTEVGEFDTTVQAAQTGKEPQFLRAKDSALLLKVVGRSDNIPIVEAPGSENALFTMEPLKPYFVLEDAGNSFQVASSQEDESSQGFVAKAEVESWNTREGLHFVDRTFNQNRRRTVTAWKTRDRIQDFFETGDGKAFGPTFKEQGQTRIGNYGIIPYPLLDTLKLEKADGSTRKIHQVLVPAVVAGTAETPGMDPDQVKAVAGAVTFCVVFDATASMDKYARNFADTIDDMLANIKVDNRLASAGFVLFRDLKDADPFEIVHPMPLKEATGWLKNRAKSMVGGDKPEEPVLDAVSLAQKSFLWNGGTAVRGAKRIAIVVANDDAHNETIGLSADITKGESADAVAGNLLRSSIPIPVFALQAGNKDGGNLINVLQTLAETTGGEFYPAASNPKEISSDFSRRLENLVSASIDEGNQAFQRIASNVQNRQGGGTVIALNVLDTALRKRLEDAATEFNISEGGLLVETAWVFEDPTLYREKILIEKELLEDLVRFFNVMTDSTLDTSSLKESTANLLEALTGEKVPPGEEVQELLELRLGVHFTTNLLSFELDQLAALGSEERGLLQDNIRDAAGALADFLDMNTSRFNTEPRIWMPVSYLP